MSIQLILGPMFSGKSTELKRRVKRYIVAKKKCIVLKYHKDKRYDDKIIGNGNTKLITHDLESIDAIECNKLFDHLDLCLSHDIIGIDEGQFYDDIVQFCELLANKGKIVIVSALDGNFLRSSFGDIHSLIPKCEDIIKLKAVCMLCQSDASFTKRLTKDTQVELIGGAEAYAAVCRLCYFKE